MKKILVVLVLAAIASLSGLAIAIITAEITIEITTKTTAKISHKSQEKQHNNGTALMNSQLISTITGSLLAGAFFEKIGRTYSILLMDFVFLVGYIGGLRFLVGFGIGMGSTLIPLFVAASCPPKIRGTIINLFKFFLTSGGFLPYFIRMKFTTVRFFLFL